MIESASENKRLLTSRKTDSKKFENRLRPLSLSEYIGQNSLKKNLSIAISAAKKRNETPDHILLHGSPGIGKTTLAAIIANEIGASLRITSGPALEKQGDIASIISNLKQGDVLFIDEIHRLKPVVEEVLYTAMEDFAIDIIIGKGASARTMRIDLPKFTLIGATTKVSMLSSPLRDRFGSVFTFQNYSNADISDIILRSAKILGCDIEDFAAEKLANCCRSTPRVANRLLKRVRDYSDYLNKKIINAWILNEALLSLGIDEYGLDERDREILRTIIEKFSGGPVGLNTLSAALNEEQDTIEEVYEPFLIQLGFLQRTARGRIATFKAFKYLKIEKA